MDDIRIDGTLCRNCLEPLPYEQDLCATPCQPNQHRQRESQVTVDEGSHARWVAGVGVPDGVDVAGIRRRQESIDGIVASRRANLNPANGVIVRPRRS